MIDFTYMVSVDCNDMDPETRFVGHHLPNQVDADNYTDYAINELRNMRNGEPGVAHISISEIHIISGGIWIRNTKESEKNI